MSIGERVLHLLREKKLKASDLAKHLNTSPSTISGWSKPNRNPSSEAIVPICEFLNIDIMYLLTGKTSNQNILEIDTDVESLIEKFNLLSNDTKHMLDDYLDYLISREQKALLSKKTESKIVPLPIEHIAHECDIDDPVDKTEVECIQLPFCGKVTAGEPIELPDAYSIADVIDVPRTQKSVNADFALEVKGDSMEPLVHNGELILVKIQSTAYDGQIVIAAIDDTATLKKFHEYPDRFELEPLNPRYPTIVIEKSEFIRFRIIGVKL